MRREKSIARARRRAAPGAVALIVASLAACSGEKRDASGDRTPERLSGIEKRLGSMESRMEMVASVAGRFEALERRVAALEARPATAAPPSPREPAPGASSGGARDHGAPWSQQSRPDAAAQSAEVARLREEFQSRLARIEADAAESSTPEAREQELRELSKWYGTQLGALLGSRPWAAQGDAKQ